MVGGRGRIVFVAGEAGTGKTALVEAFVAELHATNDEIVVAIGNCNSQGGIGDAFLPFRELLATLVGLDDDDLGSDGRGDQHRSRLRRFFDHSTKVLFDLGPDLIGTIIPGAGLAARVGQAVVGESGWFGRLLEGDSGRRPATVDQHRVFEQYANVVRSLAEERPLVLVVDDLQWADDASVGLLFHLSRRLETSRVLLVSTYRPDELALWTAGGRSSLEKVLAEIKRYAGNVTIDLAAVSPAERRAFVDAYLDTEPNELGEEFRRQLFARTDGHPLFTVELLRTMQERGQLVKDAADRWVVAALDWALLPARVEGVIEERIARLEESQRELLDVASVEGISFTAEVVGAVLGRPMLGVLRTLDRQLGRAHRLVHERGELAVADGTLAVYQFGHALFQRYLYEDLGNAQRRLLHGEIARRLGELHGERAHELAGTLAWHYDEAHRPDEAVAHYVRAGERAIGQGAPDDARRMLTRAAELSAADDGDLQRRILTARAEAVRLLGDVEARRNDLAALLALAERSGDELELARAHTAQATFWSDLGDQLASRRTADLAIDHARSAGDQTLLADCLGLLAQACIRTGEVEAGREAVRGALVALEQTDDPIIRQAVLRRAWVFHFEAGEIARSLELAEQTVAEANRLPRHARAVPASNLGLNHLALGQYELAQAALEEACAHSLASGYRRGLGYGEQNLALVTLLLGDLPQAEQLARHSLGELDEIGDAFGAAGGRMYLGHVLDADSRWEEAAAQYAAAEAAFAAAGALGLAAESRAGAGRCALRLGQRSAARAAADEVWVYLSANGGIGTDQPATMYLTCAEIIAADGEPTLAAEIIATGVQQLRSRADSIDDPAAQASFLDAVAAHRDLLRLAAEGTRGLVEPFSLASSIGPEPPSTTARS